MCGAGENLMTDILTRLQLANQTIEEAATTIEFKQELIDFWLRESEHYKKALEEIIDSAKRRMAKGYDSGDQATIDIAEQALRDDCKVCGGRKGGVRGNENIVNNVVMCDYCTIYHI
jgi:hypothetical protein